MRFRFVEPTDGVLSARQRTAFVSVKKAKLTYATEDILFKATLTPKLVCVQEILHKQVDARIIFVDRILVCPPEIVDEISNIDRRFEGLRVIEGVYAGGSNAL